MKVLLVIDIEQYELDLLNEYKKQDMIVDIGFYYDKINGWSFMRKGLLSITPLPQKVHELRKRFEL